MENQLSSNWCVINTELITNLEQHHMSCYEENQPHPGENQYIYTGFLYHLVL